MRFLDVRSKRNFTLFPYTTLFRSRWDWYPAAESRTAWVLGFAPALIARALETDCVPCDERTRNRAQLEPRRFSEDRKSTRLNSSHGYISYAVFCLKKKIKFYIFKL